MEPLSQTFNVNTEDGSDGVYLTKIDLFFKQKDATRGLTVQIRDTDNGYPSPTILGQKFVESSLVNVSATASLATTITFDTPIYLKSFKDYAITIMSDGNSPDYLIWTASPGLRDVANNNLISNKDWGGGALFTSTNDKVWTPIQTEDLKFKIYCAKFTSQNGTVVLENDNYEFLTVTMNSGSFILRENIAQKANTYLSATVTCNTSSRIVNTSASLVGTLNTGDSVLFIYGTSKTAARTGTVAVSAGSNSVTGTSTLFNTEYSVGSYTLINDQVREITSIANATSMTIDIPLSGAVTANAHFGVTPVFQVNKVLAVNTSTITVKDRPLVTVNNSTNYVATQKVVSAVVDRVNINNTITLKNSNAANNTFLFAANRILVGETSKATANIVSVDNIVVNYVEPHVSTFIPSSTGISLVQRIDGTTATPSNSNISFGLSNKTDYEATIRSRSNEIITGSKSLRIFNNLRADSNFNKLTPVVDLTPASVVTLRNVINNSNANETTRYGNAQVKYISKKVVLANGLDAEDIKVYVTAFKPSGSEILVYAKILSNEDSEIFENKDWTLLNQDTESGLFSNSLDESDFREYEYSFLNSPPSTQVSGLINSNSNTTINGFGTTFLSSLAANDIVKIVNTNTNTDYDINVVSSVTNDTTLVLVTNTTFSSAGVTIEKVTQPLAAFKYPRNNNVVNYFDSKRARHSTYKVFAVKVVLLSTTTQTVPILKDIRAIAVSI